MNSTEEFLETLRATFRVEASEHLQAISAGLLELERTRVPEHIAAQLAIVFRAAHSLKGAARAVNLSDAEALCQSLEERFSAWKRTALVPSPEELDAAHRLLDAISLAVSAEQPTKQPSATVPLASATATAPKVEPATPSTVRVSVDKLDAFFLEAEEMLAVKLVTAQWAVQLQSLTSEFERWRAVWDKARPQLRALPAGTGTDTPGAFTEWNHDQLRAMEVKINALCRTAEHHRLTVGKHVDDLLANSKKLLMLPLATLGAPLPKVVRDLSRDQGKEVDLTIRGEDVEIDKRVLEEMKDPLIHLLRNCVDHGVESPAHREQLGKPARATISLDVSMVDSHHVELLIADDGAGIDIERVKAAAIERGVLTTDAAAQLSEQDALALVFEADISTSTAITQLSGRGLGLAIVREKVEKLGGRIAVTTRPQSGTTFRITLPMTMATSRGVLVSAAERPFVLPTAEVERVVRFRPDDVKTVGARATLALNGRAVALVHLSDVLQLPSPSKPAPALVKLAVVLGTMNQRTAFAIDAVMGEQEVLIKPLKKPLVRVRHVAAMTVLGSGQVVPILRVSDLLRFATQVETRAIVAAAQPVASAAQAKRILLAEDSITSRLLLKGVLESSGYHVRTAADGMEALTLLRSEAFDLLVSDVEMPRLNGFDLVAKIRAERKLTELPVILVTALSSREDRERGVAVGADAYLAKSSFDQANLLDAVRRLA